MQCLSRGLRVWERRLLVMTRPTKYSKELRRRAVEEVLDRGRKIPEVASQLGIGSPETLTIVSLDPTGVGRQRWTNRWKPGLNAFAIAFPGRIFPTTKYS